MESLYDAGLELINRYRWQVMLLSQDSSGGKIPPRNCARCNPSAFGYERHDAASCECLLCHGFYAATTDEERWHAMTQKMYGGTLAVRTGQASRLLVIDAEAGEGLETLENFESWTGGVSLSETLASTSVSGGVHLYYALPPEALITPGRYLPSVDVKAEHGYVGVPGPGTQRHWRNRDIPVTPAPPELLVWLLAAKRTAGGRSGSGEGWGGADGYDYDAFTADGCPDGHRERFFTDMAFRLRKRGLSEAEAVRKMIIHWEHCAQPPVARWEMPWEHVEYKIRRTWATVEPDRVSESLQSWADQAASLDRGDPTKIGSKMIVRRTR